MLIDFHCHLGDWDIWAITVEEKIARFNLFGMDKGVLLGGIYNKDWRDVTGHLRFSNYKYTNEKTLEVAKKYPDIFIPFLWTNFLMPDAVQDVEYYLKEGMKGIGEIIPYGCLFPLYCETGFKICELAQKYDVPIASHTGPDMYGNPLHIISLAAEFPKVNFVMEHMGCNDQETTEQCILGASRYKNIYLGTASSTYPKLIREAAERIGADRILFGTDNGRDVDGWANDFRYEMEKIKAAGLSKKEEEMIMGLNAARLLKIYM